MADNKKEDTPGQIDRMIKQMKKEAEDKAEQIIADGKSRQQTEQNKLRDVGVQALETKYEKLREQQFITMRT
jgi:vacuolar-type H+-ATPase subunit H